MNMAFAPGSPGAVELQKAVHNKLIEYGYVMEEDTVLAEYIAMMIANDRTAEGVKEELTELIGEDFDASLVSWLFQWIQQYQASNGTESSSTTNTSRPEGPSDRLIRTAVNDAVRRDQSPRSAKGRLSRRDRSVLDRLGSRLEHPARDSRSRSPRHRREKHDQREPTFTVNLGPKSTVSFKASSNTNKRTVTSQQEREAIVNEAKGQKRIRCTFWPQCTKGAECPFFHPTKLCPDFPNCPKPADQCMFIHPATGETPKPTGVVAGGIPCKFGIYCSNPACTFVHPGRPLASETPCRFYPNCLNPACPYKHGDGEASTTADGTPVRATRKVPIPCRDGAECKRPGCHFIHPGEETDATSMIPCKFGTGCARPDCKFFHPFRNKSVRFQDGQPIPASSGPTHISERIFSVEEATEHLPVPNNAKGTVKDNNEDTEMQL